MWPGDLERKGCFDPDPQFQCSGRCHCPGQHRWEGPLATMQLPVHTKKGLCMRVFTSWCGHFDLMEPKTCPAAVTRASKRRACATTSCVKTLGCPGIRTAHRPATALNFQISAKTSMWGFVSVANRVAFLKAMWPQQVVTNSCRTQFVKRREVMEMFTWACPPVCTACTSAVCPSLCDGFFLL